MNHCFIRSFSASQRRAQVINQKCPYAIDGKQINREEDNGDQSDQRRVPHHHERRPRNPAHFAAGVAQKLGDPLQRNRASRPGQSTLASHRRPQRPRQMRLRVGGTYRSVFRRTCRAPPVARPFPLRRRHRSHVSLTELSFATQLLYRSQMAGVPGFEPGLSVLETDVLTVDTIPLQ